ncbi:MAG: PqqD family protein [Clostridia bacterium]|nr:PqqD family protein [Clostridia bacterium]
MKNRKYSIKQGYVAREIAGEYIAVPVDNSVGSNIVVLNEVSKLLWDELKSEKTFDELLNAMLANYDVSKEEAEVDLKDFLVQLEANGLTD